MITAMPLTQEQIERVQDQNDTKAYFDLCGKAKNNSLREMVLGGLLTCLLLTSTAINYQTLGNKLNGSLSAVGTALALKVVSNSSQSYQYYKRKQEGVSENE
jgi:hypothetical protein